jgi:hypothetical protein
MEGLPYLPGWQPFLFGRLSRVPCRRNSGAERYCASKQLTYGSPSASLTGQLFDVGTADPWVTVPIVVVGVKTLYRLHGIAYLRSRQATKRACCLHPSVSADWRQEPAFLCVVFNCFRSWRRIFKPFPHAPIRTKAFLPKPLFPSVRDLRQKINVSGTLSVAR